jgi:hypothetical protein
MEMVSAGLGAECSGCVTDRWRVTCSSCCYYYDRSAANRHLALLLVTLHRTLRVQRELAATSAAFVIRVFRIC